MARDRLHFVECADCLCLASRRAALAITRSFERKLRGQGIRPTQFSILTNVILRGSIGVGALANALGVERTTLTRTLATIEREGWIEVRPGKDARSREVRVTPAGLAKTEEALPAWRAAQKEIGAKIGKAGADALRRLAAQSGG